MNVTKVEKIIQIQARLNPKLIKLFLILFKREVI
nr:MAG TPA: hypothetical protein [Caudoviricetes sp.]